jgi:hypothetical protein
MPTPGESRRGQPRPSVASHSTGPQGGDLRCRCRAPQAALDWKAEFPLKPFCSPRQSAGPGMTLQGMTLWRRWSAWTSGLYMGPGPRACWLRLARPSCPTPPLAPTPSLAWKRHRAQASHLTRIRRSFFRQHLSKLFGLRELLRPFRGCGVLLGEPAACEPELRVRLPGLILPALRCYKSANCKERSQYGHGRNMVRLKTRPAHPVGIKLKKNVQES